MVRSRLIPMDIECLKKRTEKAIKRFGIKDLMEYTLGCPAGCDLGDFYKTVVEEVLVEETYICVSEMSDGKYEVAFEFEGKDRDNVIIPHIKKGGMKICQDQFTA